MRLENYGLLKERQPEIGGALSCQRMLAFLFKQLLIRNCVVNFVEICNVCARKAIIKAATRISNSDSICRSYCGFYFGVTFFEHSVYMG